MATKEQVISMIRKELSIHENQVYVPVNRQVLNDILKVLEEPEKTETKAKAPVVRRTKK